MKKLHTTILFLTGIIFLTSCKSLFYVPQEPDTDIKKGMLKKHFLEASSLKGAYGNFSQNFTLFSDDSDQNKEEQTKGGIVYQVRTQLGKEYFIPKNVPIRYHKGLKKGKPVIKKMKEYIKSFLYEIVSFFESEDETWISIDIE
ncbi:MAG: hypothetical protein ACPGTS_00590, partial [Minisyncoccia bacterium]